MNVTQLQDAGCLENQEYNLYYKLLNKQTKSFVIIYLEEYTWKLIADSKIPKYPSFSWTNTTGFDPIVWSILKTFKTKEEILLDNLEIFI